MSEEKLKIESLIYTLAFCFLLFLLLLFYRVTINVEESIKFTEVIFTPSVETETMNQPTISGTSGSIGVGSKVQARTIRLPKINLPVRTSTVEEEILPYKYAEKIDVVEKPGKIEGEIIGTVRGKEDAGLGKSISPLTGKIGGESKPGIGLGSKAFSGSDLSSKVTFKIDWEGGINRVKVEGFLPRFPEGVRESGVVRFKIIVLPDGKIERIFPLEKANPEFERAVFEALQTWRFNKVDRMEAQTGVVTFNFKLE